MIASKALACSLTLALLVTASAARADLPEGSNLLGQHGILRVNAATPLSPGWLSIATDFQFFKASGLLAANADHQRMVNTYTINWAPFRFLEAAFALHVSSDSNSVTSATTGITSEELQVAVGDPELSIKGGYEIGSGFALGGIFDLRLPSAAGFFEASGSAINILFGVLGSWSGGNNLPLGVHLNVGFLRDGSGNLFADPSKLTTAQLFAAQVSSFNRLVTRLGVEYITSYVGPFMELSLEPYVGSLSPSFGSSPGILSFGTRVWPTKAKGLQLIAAMDIGITGVGDGTPIITDPGKYAFVIPRWNLLLQLSYRFEPFAEPKVIEKTITTGPVETIPKPVAKGVVIGDIVDERTNKPIWNARVRVEGEQASGLAVNPSDGTFRSFKLEPGRYMIAVSADGYAGKKAEVVVTPNGETQAQFRLARRTTFTPGTLRGTIKSISGAPLANAMVLIPQINQTIAADADGSFTLSLKPGEYQVHVSAKGYRTQTKTIRILEGSTIILNVDLYR